MTRFLRPTGTDTWDVYVDDEIIGSVRREGFYPLGGTTDDWQPVYKARTARNRIPMPNGSVLSADDNGVPHSYERRTEPLHSTLHDAAEMITLAVETGRILNEQIDYERANGWSTD